MFINDAFAAATPAAETGTLDMFWFEAVLLLLIFYFLLVRPQQKRIREHAEMVAALKVGDKVLLSSGIYGKISAIKDDKLILEIAKGVEITVDHMTVGAVVSDEKKTADKAKK